MQLLVSTALTGIDSSVALTVALMPVSQVTKRCCLLRDHLGELPCNAILLE